MAKNKLAKELAYFEKKIKQIVPQVYACIALALFNDYGWTYEQIAELFDISQKIWQDNANRQENMLERCANETGIELRDM